MNTANPSAEVTDPPNGNGPVRRLVQNARSWPPWRLVRVLPGAHKGWAVAWWALLLVRAAMPSVFAVASGWLVAAVSTGDDVLGPLVGVALSLVVLQFVAPLHSAVSQNLGFLLGAHLADRLATATVAPAGLRHLEDPELAGDLSTAREFDLGITQVPMFLALDFVTAGFVQFLAGVVAAIVLATYTWWAAVLLLIAWSATHLLLRESGVWKDRNTEPVQRARRDSEYAFNIAVEPEYAKELRLFGLREWTLDRFAAARRLLFDYQYEATRLRERSIAAAALLVIAANLVVFWSLGAESASGSVSVAVTVVAAQLALGVQAIAFGGLNWALDDAAHPVQAVERLEPKIPKIGALRDLPVHELPTSRGGVAIQIRDLAFSYPRTSQPVYTGLSLDIAPGESLAIVGVNGAGKTTLAKLLCRFYDPDDGQILVDGIDLRALDVTAWRRQVTAVFQDVLRLELSLRDNVDPGHQAGDDQVRHTLHLAGAATVAGLETPLSKAYAGGTDLSGGQWQRVALARALCAVGTGARLVLLDEPTASLDIRGELTVFRRLLDGTAGATRILISHRFSTVRMADRIAVLEHGAIIELGTHDQLIAAGGRYAQMYALQASRFDADTDDTGTRYDRLG